MALALLGFIADTRTRNYVNRVLLWWFLNRQIAGQRTRQWSATCLQFKSYVHTCSCIGVALLKRLVSRGPLTSVIPSELDLGSQRWHHAFEIVPPFKSQPRSQALSSVSWTTWERGGQNREFSQTATATRTSPNKIAMHVRFESFKKFFRPLQNNNVKWLSSMYFEERKPQWLIFGNFFLELNAVGACLAWANI